MTLSHTRDAERCDTGSRKKQVRGRKNRKVGKGWGTKEEKRGALR